MLGKTLIASCLLVASSAALAGHDYVSGRVIRVEPSLSLSFSSGNHHNGFRVLYESGGRHYWTHSDYYPRDVIYVPRPVYVEPVYYGDRGRHHRRGHHRHHDWHPHHRHHDWHGHHRYGDGWRHHRGHHD